MTASLLLKRQEIYLVDIAEIDRLIADLANLDRLRKKPDSGLVWFFQIAPDIEVPNLIVGVRGDLGALMWCDEEEGYVPVCGVNPEWMDYFTWDGHHFVMPPGAEVPIEVAHTALREFTRTRQRPTCVEWKLETPWPEES